MSKHNFNQQRKTASTQHSEAMKIFLLFIALLATLFTIGIFFPELVLAQTPPPPDLPAKPTQNPIDGGLVLLAAAGGGYAIKKLRDKQK